MESGFESDLSGAKFVFYFTFQESEDYNQDFGAGFLGANHKGSRGQGRL